MVNFKSQDASISSAQVSSTRAAPICVMWESFPEGEVTMMLFGKRLRQQETDFDQIGDELLLSLKVSEDEIEDEIDEIVSSPDFFAGIQSRIRERRTYQTMSNRTADRRTIGTGLDIVPGFLAPYRSPRWVLTAVGVLLLVATGLLMVLPKKPNDQDRSLESTNQTPILQTERTAPAPELAASDKPQLTHSPGGDAKD